MGEITGPRPPFDPFAALVARRQHEEELRRSALFSRFGGNPRPFVGTASPPTEGQSNGSDQLLLRTADDTTPLQLSKQTPLGSQAGFGPPGSTGTDSLLSTTAAPNLAAPLLIGSSLALGAEAVEGLSGPVGWALLLPTLGLAYALSRSGGSAVSPNFGGSTKADGAIGVPPPITQPPPGFPGTPLPNRPLPEPTPRPTEKPTFENIPTKIQTQPPPFPIIDDDLLEERIRAGSKTPWADAYPEVHDWVKTFVENSKGDDQTQKDVEIIIRAYVNGFRRRNVVATHTGGGSEAEKYYGDPEHGRLGSGRPDGSFTVGSEEEPYDFNTYDTWKDGETPTARESKGRTNLERLRNLVRQDRIKEGRSSKPGRFDMLPKSRYFPSHAEWERFINQKIENLLDQEFGPPSD